MSKNNSNPKIRIISRSDQRFEDRQEAGKLLAQELTEYKNRKAVALGIPRGGIIVAREIAKALNAELDIVLARKLRTPGQLELGMGSVSEDGTVFLNSEVVGGLGLSQAHIDAEKRVQMGEIARRSSVFRQVRPKVPLQGKTVIITDDGVATGATFQAALWSVRQEHPAKLIAAVPVSSEDTILNLAKDADEMIVLRAPPFFMAVGQFYAKFNQVEDEEIIEILKEESKRKRTV